MLTSSITTSLEQTEQESTNLSTMSDGDLQKRFYELFRKNDESSKKEMEKISDILEKRSTTSNGETADKDKYLRLKELEVQFKTESNKEDYNSEVIMKILGEINQIKNELRSKKDTIHTHQRTRAQQKNAEDLRNRKETSAKDAKMEDLMKKLNEQETENKRLTNIINDPENMYLPLQKRWERKRLLMLTKDIKSLQNNPEQAVIYVITMTRKLLGGKITQAIKQAGISLDSGINAITSISGKVGASLNKGAARKSIDQILEKYKPVENDPELIKYHKQELSNLIKNIWNTYLKQDIANYEIK